MLRLDNETLHPKWVIESPLGKAPTPGNTQGPSYRARLALSQKVNRKLKIERLLV